MQGVYIQAFQQCIGKGAQINNVHPISRETEKISAHIEQQLEISRELIGTGRRLLARIYNNMNNINFDEMTTQQTASMLRTITDLLNTGSQASERALAIEALFEKLANLY